MAVALGREPVTLELTAVTVTGIAELCDGQRIIVEILGGTPGSQTVLATIEQTYAHDDVGGDAGSTSLSDGAWSMSVADVTGINVVITG